MKTKLSAIPIILAAFAMEPSVSAQMALRAGGYGRGDGRGMSIHGGGNVGGGTVSRGLGVSRPTGSIGTFRSPVMNIPQRAPISQPYTGGMRFPKAGPIYQSAPMPQTTWRSGGTFPNLGAIRRIPNQPGFQRPAVNQLPGSIRPFVPGNITGGGNRGFATFPPARRASEAPRLARPDGGNLRIQPVQPGQTARGSQWRPNDFLRPNRPSQLGGGQQWRPGGSGQFNPDQRPGSANRPIRPTRPGNWQNVEINNIEQWSRWKQTNDSRVNNFRSTRWNTWNNIASRSHQRDWAGRFRSSEFGQWRRDVWDFRRNRAEEIWCHRHHFWNNIFDDHWWHSCWWSPSTTVWVDTSPWWWWQPFTWDSVGPFFGSTIAAEPVIYDPGTTVIYEGDTYYVDGVAAGPAVDARRAASDLASPPVQQFPVPTPPAGGQTQDWLPMGVWALTQQEQGDATMFMQFSIDKNGILAGAYKNLMSGDEQPIVGQLDKETQRVAWHIGNATQTVYETGLSGFENDVVSVFVHFGDVETQTWLLVRLPSPEMPPGIVKLPALR